MPDRSAVGCTPRSNSRSPAWSRPANHRRRAGSPADRRSSSCRSPRSRSTPRPDPNATPGPQYGSRGGVRSAPLHPKPVAPHQHQPEPTPPNAPPRDLNRSSVRPDQTTATSVPATRPPPCPHSLGAASPRPRDVREPTRRKQSSRSLPEPAGSPLRAVQRAGHRTPWPTRSHTRQ